MQKVRSFSQKTPHLLANISYTYTASWRLWASRWGGCYGACQRREKRGRCFRIGLPLIADRHINDDGRLRLKSGIGDGKGGPAVLGRLLRADLAVKLRHRGTVVEVEIEVDRSAAHASWRAPVDAHMEDHIDGDRVVDPGRRVTRICANGFRWRGGRWCQVGSGRMQRNGGIGTAGVVDQ